jgi:hypothetical protein
MINFPNFIRIVLSCADTEQGLNESIFCLFIKHGFNRTKLLHSFFTKRKTDEYFSKYKNLDYITNNIVSGDEQEYVINHRNQEAVDYFARIEAEITKFAQYRKAF